MKLSKLAFTSIVAALLMSLTVSAKNEMKRVYMFGIAASFNDSTVYFTAVQEVDSAWIYSKNKSKFLVSRENYSYQLRDYLESRGENNRTCAVFFGTNHKKVEGQWVKLHNKYTTLPKQKKNKRGGDKPAYHVKVINNGEFFFKPITPTEDTQEVKSAKKSKKKK